MKTATLGGLLSLLSLLVAACSPDRQGTRPADKTDTNGTAAKTEKGTGGETEPAGQTNSDREEARETANPEDAADSEPPKKIANDPESTPADFKPDAAEVAAQIKELIPKASAMAREDMDKLARSTTMPTASDLEDKSLTFMLFTLRPKDDEAAKQQFQYLTDRHPKPSAIAKEIYRVGIRVGKLRLLKGPVTFIHADRITDLTCNVEGDTAKGTVAFKVPDLYQGSVKYVAKRKDGNWQIQEFILPAYDTHLVRNAEGTWEQLSSEQRADAAEPSIDTIDLNVTARRTIKIRGDETPIDGANSLRSRLSSLTEQLGKKPAAIPVRITVDDGASYGDCKQVIRACQENRFERFVLQLGGDSYPFSVPTAAPSERFLYEGSIPPLRLRLKAGQNGEIRQILLNQRAFRRLSDVRSPIAALLGDERGPGSIADSVELELECDDALKFEHVAEAYQVVSWYVDDSGKRVPLIKTVWPFGSPHIEELEELEEIEIEPIDTVPEAAVPEEVLEIEGQPDSSMQAIEVELAPPGPAPRENERHMAPVKVELTDIADESTATPFAVRKSNQRAKLIQQYGGSKESEAAMVAALKWVAAHQLPDGGWSFDHRLGACQGRCPNQGTLKDARNAATAMAILPMLAAGQTHTEGKYKATVKRGLSFLVTKMKVDRKAGTGTLEESGGRGMYSHGLCTIALCEDYNYYATQVMFHNGGEPWKRWNAKMRDQLIATQTKEGHATGSWHVAGGDQGADHGGTKGGRLYCTSLATMILETYYRHGRLYRERNKE